VVDTKQVRISDDAGRVLNIGDMVLCVAENSYLYREAGIVTMIRRDGVIRVELHGQEGVYVGLRGPSLETPAEIRFLRTIGADAVGFSTALEVIAAVHAGMKVLGLSTITNIHNPDDPNPSSVEEIIAVAQAAAPKLEGIIRKVIENVDASQLG